MDRIDTIRDELTNDPLGRGYTGMSDVAAAADMNSVEHASPCLVSNQQIKAKAIVNGATEALYVADDDPQYAADVKGKIKQALQFVDNGLDPVDVSHQRFGEIFDALITAGILTAQQKAEFVALGTETISRGEALGVGRVYPGEIAEARS